jgi:hypothetical protein
LIDPSSGNVEETGIMKIAKELELDLMDPLFLVISYLFKAKTMVVIYIKKNKQINIFSFREYIERKSLLKECYHYREIT